ncbi:hypothetical protein Tco_0093690 [Tanacetum coccineum]
MRTRRSNYPNNSNVTIPRHRRKQVSNIVEPEIRTIVEMAERTMEELLRSPTEGYGEAIILPEINADHFESKHICFNWVNTNSRESFSKTDERIDKLVDQISTLVEIVSKKVVTPGTVKAVEESCVTCGGVHAYYNCPNTDSNQSSVCATMGTYNQVSPPNHVSNHMAPPGFAPAQNNGQNRYVVPTSRVVVPTGRYIVHAGKVIIIVSTGRLSLVPTGRVLSPGRVK